MPCSRVVEPSWLAAAGLALPRLGATPADPQMPKRRVALYRGPPVERAFDGVRRWVWNEGFFNTCFGDDAGVSWFGDYIFMKHVTYSCPSVKFLKIVSHTAHNFTSWTAESTFSLRFLIFHQTLTRGTFQSGFIQKIVLQHKDVQNQMTGKTVAL